MVEDRIKTSFELSIATGLALESLFEPTSVRYDEEREIPNKIDFNKFKTLVINGYTLVRNILNSLEPRIPFEYLEKHGKQLYPNIINAIQEEIDLINSLVISTNQNNICRILLPNYNSSIVSYNINKEGELAYVNNTLALIKLTNIFFSKIDDSKIIKLQNSIIPNVFNNNKTIYLTHIPSDLIYCDNLYLLESHTGILKTQVDFYSKFSGYGKNSLIRIPFNKYTLFILGDHVFVKSLGLKAKKIIYSLAEENKWNYRTNENIVFNKLLKTDIIDDIKKFNTNFRR